MRWFVRTIRTDRTDDLERTTQADRPKTTTGVKFILSHIHLRIHTIHVRCLKNPTISIALH